MKPASLRSRLVFYLRLCRPEQWPKNVFVLAPAFFSERILIGYHLVTVLVATACFCVLSSAVYIFNDLRDAESDRSHPRKRNRPIASGSVSRAEAAGLIGLLLTTGFVGASLLPIGVLLAAGCYLANSLIYCLWLKHRVIVDVLLIAIGFVIRLLGGCAAVEVEPSSWLILCGFALALLLGFGKRRTEIQVLGDQAETRSVLNSYHAAKLDALLSATTAVCVLAYALYTVAPDTVQRHGTTKLIYTLPLVCYGLFRYMFKVQEGRGDGPTDILLRDKAFWLAGAAWVAVVAAILYVRIA